MAQRKQNPLSKERITIPFEHLRFRLREIIGKGGLDEVGKHLDKRGVSSIRVNRKLRGMAEGGLVTNALISSYYPVLGGAGTLYSTFLRFRDAVDVQSAHEILLEAMNKQGIISPRFEGHHPEGWLNPAVVASTHPIFFVNRKGDLVFLKENRGEYYRFAFQKSLPGKLGLNLWRWRAYLRPPKAPATVREWAKAKVEAAKARLPRRALGAVRVPAGKLRPR